MQSFLFISLARWVGALSSAPFDWARGWFQRWAFAGRRAFAWVEQPSPEATVSVVDAAWAWQAHGVAAGFDFARAQYAAGVRAGLIERSLLASGAFERRLGQLERLTLGPLARRV